MLSCNSGDFNNLSRGNHTSLRWSFTTGTRPNSVQLIWHPHKIMFCACCREPSTDAHDDAKLSPLWSTNGCCTVVSRVESFFLDIRNWIGRTCGDQNSASWTCELPKSALRSLELHKFPMRSLELHKQTINIVSSVINLQRVLQVRHMRSFVCSVREIHCNWNFDYLPAAAAAAASSSSCQVCSDVLQKMWSTVGPVKLKKPMLLKIGALLVVAACWHWHGSTQRLESLYVTPHRIPAHERT
jgi:hypothetical protein